MSPPVSSSPGYPAWICKNSCGRRFEPDTKLTECPACRAPIVRWLEYEERPRHRPDPEQGRQAAKYIGTDST